MLGRTHFASGVLVTEGLACVVHLTPAETVTGLVVGSCAALLPDIDHPSSTVSRTFGPLTQGFATPMARCLGGHRFGTHSLPGILFFGLVMQVCVFFRHSPPAQVIVSAVLIVTLAAGVRIFRIKGIADDLAPIPVVIGIVWFTDVSLSAVPAALVLGCIVHVAGDCMTNSGCPILWPFDKEDRLALKLFSTGKLAEKLIVYPLILGGWFCWARGWLFLQPGSCVLVGAGLILTSHAESPAAPRGGRAGLPCA